MKIKSLRSIGTHRTYSPEMKSERHNYITDSSPSVHANSHAVSYCLVALRCLYLKARFPAEWWAAVMSGCHPDKLVRFIAVAKSEDVKITSMNPNNLTVQFTVTGDVVNQGMIGVKKIGAKAAELFATREGDPDRWEDIEHFIASKPKNKTVMERLIKLGSFSGFQGHENSKALWSWYLYRHGSGVEITKLRKEVREALLVRDGWTPEAIQRERRRQVEAYREQYPKRNTIPTKLLNWSPRARDGRESVMALFEEDYTKIEMLNIEKEFLGYYLSNPMRRFNYRRHHDLPAIKDGETDTLHAIVQKVEYGVTKKGAQMCRVNLFDGQYEVMLLLWEDDCVQFKPILDQVRLVMGGAALDDAGRRRRPEVALAVRVNYSRERKSCTMWRPGKFGSKTPAGALTILDDAAE